MGREAKATISGTPIPISEHTAIQSQSTLLSDLRAHCYPISEHTAIRSQSNTAIQRAAPLLVRALQAPYAYPEARRPWTLSMLAGPSPCGGWRRSQATGLYTDTLVV